jgi:hypothetical protein
MASINKVMPNPNVASWALLLLAVLPGILGVVVFSYYALVDWSALQSAYTHYEQVANSSADLRTVFIAESDQNIHRVNLFADGVWTLLSALLMAVGLHGISRSS